MISMLDGEMTYDEFMDEIEKELEEGQGEK